MRELGRHPETGETIYVVLGADSQYILCGKDRLYLKKTGNYKSMNLNRAVSLIKEFNKKICLTTNNSLPSKQGAT